MTRVLRVGDLSIVVRAIRAWEVNGPERARRQTLVWLADFSHPFTLDGDHGQELRLAVEGGDR